MPERMATTHLKSYLSFPFSDSEWRRRFMVGTGLILAALIVPIVPLLFVYGYLLQIMRRAAEGEEPALPAWEDWGRLATDGLRAMVVWFVAILPGGLITAAGAAFYALVITAADAAWYGSPDQALRGFWTVVGGMGIFYLASALGMVLLVIELVPMPMALAHLAAEGRLGAAFRLPQWWPLIRAAKWDYFAAWIVVAGLAGLSYWATLIPSYTVVLCCLTPLIGAPLALYVGLVGAATFGSVYHQARASQAMEGQEVGDGEEGAQPV
jgi:hypothetical protein